MEPPNVVLFHRDSRTAEVLSASLASHCHSLHVARNASEIRPSIAKHRAEVLVLDLETLGLNEVQDLHKEFPNLSIVCTHRLADEELWAEALRKGAADMCEPRRPDDVVASVLREQAHRAAA